MNRVFFKAKEILTPQLPLTAVAGFSTFLVVTFVLHFIQPDYDISKEYVSEFVLGAHGWLLNIGIAGNLAGCTAFTLAFYFYFHKTYKSWICMVCLVIATLSVITNFFPTDIHGKAVTISGYIHNFGTFIGTLVIFPVMIIFPYQLKKIGLLKGIYFLLAVLAPLAPVFYLILLIIVDSAPEFIGIGQRVYALIIMLWLILAAFRLKSREFKCGKLRV